MPDQASPSSKTQQQQPIRGGPFPITLLNRIFGFYAATASDLILRLSPVCRQWRETELLFASDTWERVSKLRWGSNLKGRRWGHLAYERRAKVLAGCADELPEIEGCFVDNNNNNNSNTTSGDDEDQQKQQNQNDPYFSFRCPMLSQNLILTGEVLPSNNLNVLFCDVCSKKVYPCVTKDELDKQTSQGRCVMIPAEAAQHIFRINKKGVLPSSTIAPDFLSNICVVTTEPSSSIDGAAEQFLKLVAHQCQGMCRFTFSSGRQQYAKDKKAAHENNKTKPRNLFLSREVLSITCQHETAGSYSFLFVVVRVPPPPPDFCEANAQDSKFVKLHPASTGNALNPTDSIFPTVNGWNSIVCVTPEAAAWFDGKNKLPRMKESGASKIAALILSGDPATFINKMPMKELALEGGDRWEALAKRDAAAAAEAAQKGNGGAGGGGDDNEKQQTASVLVKKEINLKELAVQTEAALEAVMCDQDRPVRLMGEVPPPETNKKCVMM